MSYNVLLERLLKNVGGCGRFQWILALVISLGIAMQCWSMLHMSFMGQEPSYICIRNNNSDNFLLNRSEESIRTTSCTSTNVTDCSRHHFEDGIHTVVSEWNLVCDREWIVATITTLQMAGTLVGCFVAGQLGDWLGRKPIYYLSIVVLVALNIIAYFSVSWQMYATVRFFIGIGLGFCLTNQMNLVCEFLTTTWRPVFISFPTWALVAGGFALLAWLSKDWKTIHLATAIVGAPFLLSWWIIPESFRWLVTKGRYTKAEMVINKIARMNDREAPDITELVAHARLEDSIRANYRYSVLDLFKTRENIVKSLALIFIWCSMSYAYYGLTFGIQNMSGDLYINMFLMNVIEIPANFVTMYIVNRFGRKKWCIVSFFFTGLCGVGNGILQHTVIFSGHDVLVNVFALGSRLGLAAGWTAQAVMTIEQYPTVIRGAAYGLANTAARIGGMVAPQIVFLNNHIPGILFFLSAATMIVSSFLCFLFTETKGKDLEDTMRTSLNHRESSLINSIKLKPVLDHTTVKIDDIVKPASRKADTPEKDTRSGTISEIVDA